MILDFFWRVWDFTVAVGAQWIVWGVGILFTADQLLSRNFWPPEFTEKLNYYLPEHRRHVFFRWLAIVGIVIAVFVAFDRKEVQSENATASNVEARASIKFKMVQPGMDHDVKEQFNISNFPLAYRLADGSWLLVLTFEKPFKPLRPALSVNGKPVDPALWSTNYMWPSAIFLKLNEVLVKSDQTFDIQVSGTGR